MPISIVVGGQFGSEGKGKVAHYLAKEKSASIAVRCGGSNSGHTVIDKDGIPQIFRHLPTAAILSDVNLALCAGSYIDIHVLKEEICRAKVDINRLAIDPYAVIITEEHKVFETNTGLIKEISSTGSGTGAAVLSRLQRKNTVFAKDVPELSQFIRVVNADLRCRLERKERIILEGTQGFGLSPFHSAMNPYVTTRDTTAAGFLSEVGLSPFDVDEVVLVIRTFPIRVGGSSGPLPNEINWETLSKESGGKNICELTSVTKQIRRVARFDANIVKKAIASNAPSTIALNHLDYLMCNNENHQPAIHFIEHLEKSIGCRIDLLGFGPSTLSKRGSVEQ